MPMVAHRIDGTYRAMATTQRNIGFRSRGVCRADCCSTRVSYAASVRIWPGVATVVWLSTARLALLGVVEKVAAREAGLAAERRDIGQVSMSETGDKLF